jgi:SHS2 domain-containing protein
LSSSKVTVEHVGEWRIEIRADSVEDLFAETARFVASATGPTDGQFGPWQAVSVEGRDHEALLVDWANELIGRSEVTARAYSEVRNLVITQTAAPSAGSSQPASTGDAMLTLNAQIRGQPVVSWESPLKAATYHGVMVRRAGDGWRADILFDV